MSALRVVVLSDTHSPRFWKRAPPRVAEILDGCDAILHAGDVCRAETLDELAGFAPVHVVRGNNDGSDVADWGAPDTLEFALDGLAVAMIHDSGPRAGRPARLRRRFPDAALVVFGHSHVPVDETHAGQRILNPGSPTDKRRQPVATLAELVIRDARLVTARILPVS